VFSSYIRNPFYFIDELTYRLTGRMTPKKGLPKFIAQMWDIEKLMWFDESYLKDPNGFDTELTVGSFLGPMILLMMKPLITVLFFPFLYLWQDLAFWSQLLMFVIFGWTQVQGIGE
jgi:hypothetical protein